MPEPASTTSEVIADRYLTSPAALRARPYGPVDALDTHSGRAAQVRIVFADGGWGEAELSDAVARWCAIGASGVCGVLDFGRHHDRWFLVLPPTLGMPVERWRSVRRPGLSDAARLVLGFGRLVESVAAAGFGVGVAQPGDFAVGPGPTTFLEHPLIGAPGTATPIDRRAQGQALLAQLFDCVAPDGPAPAELGGWTARAAAAGFGSLGECLDELERVSVSLVATRSADHEPAGVGSVFDSQIDLRLPASRRGLWLGRVRASVVVVLLVLTALVWFGRVAHGQPAAPASNRASTPATHTVPAASGQRPVPGSPRHVKRHRTARPRRVSRHRRSHEAPAAPAPSTPAQTPSPPSSQPASDGATSLPRPGGTVLPPA